MSTDTNINTIHCCTEIMHNQLLMQCHPSYQGEGPWFDWVSLHFKACTFNRKTFPEGNDPSKVQAILSNQPNLFLEETEIVVQSSLAHMGKTLLCLKSGNSWMATLLCHQAVSWTVSLFWSLRATRLLLLIPILTGLPVSLKQTIDAYQSTSLDYMLTIIITLAY